MKKNIPANVMTPAEKEEWLNKVLPEVSKDYLHKLFIKLSAERLKARQLNKYNLEYVDDTIAYKR